MANAKGSANVKNMIQTGKSSLLPPKSPFPVPTSSYADYGLPSIGPKAIPKPKEGNVGHQRTSSESFLVEEQPSWLDDLLNEPETPVRRGHRRSSSDSFAYVDMASLDYLPMLSGERKYNKDLASLWGSQNFDLYKDIRQGSFNTDPNMYPKHGNKAWELPSSSCVSLGSISSLRDNSVSLGTGSLSVWQEGERCSYAAAEKQDNCESHPLETKVVPENKDTSHGKIASENDTKRAKQQFAQRSRVRKLQYIAELERNVQGLQAEGSEVSAELEFVNQQNLIMSMENKALKQRLESLAQEHLIKRLEHEVLEREIARLRALYQQQLQQSQQPPQQQAQQQRQSSSTHRRSNSKDLDVQFASMSLKNRGVGSGNESVNGSVRI